MTGTSLFEVENLVKEYPVRGDGFLSGLVGEQQYMRAVDEVSFDIQRGEILGLAGQSGCGKSTLGELLLQLRTPTNGNIIYDGDDLTTYGKSQLKAFREQCQIIFQDPFESLNPRYTVARTVSEPLVIHGIDDTETREARVARALEDAGLRPPGKYLERLPSELSGGERQRVAIARALVLDPDFLLADEPVSMLDVSVSTGILNQFKKLQDERNITMVYISHDLGTINYLADRTGIMYLGNLVEIGETERVIQNAAHPYTESLLSAVPNSDPTEERGGTDLASEVPSPSDLPSGCRFRPSCPYATEECADEEPTLEWQSDARAVACYHPTDD